MVCSTGYLSKDGAQLRPHESTTPGDGTGTSEATLVCERATSSTSGAASEAPGELLTPERLLKASSSRAGAGDRGDLGEPPSGELPPGEPSPAAPFLSCRFNELDLQRLKRSCLSSTLSSLSSTCSKHCKASCCRSRSHLPMDHNSCWTCANSSTPSAKFRASPSNPGSTKGILRKRRPISVYIALFNSACFLASLFGFVRYRFCAMCSSYASWNFLPMMAIGKAINRIPESIVTAPTHLPRPVCGMTSPKPTVVIVTIDHQKASTIVGKSMGAPRVSQQMPKLELNAAES
mmetsp:Transcript_125040/g.361680  ORF Transcript_125040/g.361680 Transcript_125040/m.361680 type:complete len:291 (+) Transcript_125040:202-1074(+)